MSDTHINAFHGAVDEAKAKVVEAQGELDKAEAALKAHPDYKEPKNAKKELEEDDEEEAREAEGEGQEYPPESSDAGTLIKVSVKRKRKRK